MQLRCDFGAKGRGYDFLKEASTGAVIYEFATEDGLLSYN